MIITLSLMAVLAAGFFIGRVGMLDLLAPYASDIVFYSLCLMVFICSMGMGRDYKEGTDEKITISTIYYAAGTIIGTLLTAPVLSLIFGFTLKDSAVVVSGMGWYSLATGLVYSYNPALSVASFSYCVSREIFAVLLMPILIKKFRKPEVVAIGGSATINACAAASAVTGDNSILIYGMITGSIISVLVPFMLGFFISI